MKLIYIAGPFRAHIPWEVEQNVRRAEALALKVWQAGAAALCPHTNTRFFDKAASDTVFLEGTLEMLRRCDAIILTPEWEWSQGTRAEIREALSLGLPVFMQEEMSEFRLWLQEKSFRSMTWRKARARIDIYEAQHKSKPLE